MRLSKQAIKRINNTEMRMKIGLVLKVGEQSIRHYINANDDNGDLTRIGVLQLISEETGMSTEQILTTDKTHRVKAA